MENTTQKQQTFTLENGIILSSQFQSGNLAKVVPKDNNIFNLWVEADPFSTYKTWFYFSIEGIQPGTTATFCFMNLSNQVKLFKEGHLPVFSSQQDPRWKRITQPIQQNGMVKGEEGFQLTFRHTFNFSSRYYFAFSYPWTYSENNQMIENLIQKHRQQYFCDYRPLCLTSKKVPLKILTVTKIVDKSSVEVKEIKELEDFQCYTFPNKKGIYISARVHPGEVAASHMLNGFIRYLFSKQEEAEKLLQTCVFYIVPIVNPDGVIQGNFRCDSRGKNLNRFYTTPSPSQQPEIFGIKTFLLNMVRSKQIEFVLDLHAHVNKQGVFMYGNSTASLKQQLAVCLFPKLLEYNCKQFDYDSCNFSEKNMSSKDKADDLSKEGASRVAIYRQTGLPSCWTLQCNYNSCRVIGTRPKPCEEQSTSKSVSNGVLADINNSTKKQELTLLNLKQFQEIGANIAQTILDYYHLRKIAPCYGSRLKNAVNFKLSLAINMLRMIPFRFDNDCRKIISAVNNCQCLNQNFGKILQKIGQDPLTQYMNSKALKQRSNSKQKQEGKKVLSQKIIKDNKDTRQIKSSKVMTIDRVVKKDVKTCSVVEKQSLEMKQIIVIGPNLPKVPKKK